LTVSPNPVKSYLKVNYSSLGSEEIEITLFDLKGYKYYVKKELSANGFETEIDLSTLHLADGMYFLSVLSNKEKEIKRFFVLNK
jgi:hypothetical protein